MDNEVNYTNERLRKEFTVVWFSFLITWALIAGHVYQHCDCVIG